MTDLETAVSEWSRAVGVVGALAVIAAGPLPWFYRIGESSRGFAYAEWYVAVAGLLVVLAVVLWTGWRTRARLVTAVFGVAVAANARANHADARDLATHDPAIGLYVLGLAGVTLLAVPAVAAIECSDRWHVPSSAPE